VPYAILAGDAERLGGEAAVAFVTEDELPDFTTFSRTVALAAVATSGAYADLVGAPDLSPFLRSDGSVAADTLAVEGTLTAGAVVVDGTDMAAELRALRAELWCLRECDATRQSDCRARECDGVAETCTAAGLLADGTACRAGAGHCRAGVCYHHRACGDMACPHLSDYTLSCNLQGFCEYRYEGVDASAWRSQDVWIWVPPGSFPMGRPESEAGQPNELPQHTVTFAQGFFIAKYEVGVQTYEACEAVGSCTAPSVADWNANGLGVNRTSNGRGSHPQNGLQWQQAQEFCVWLGGRLPSEAEWEYAAKGPVHRKYPWGDTPEPTCANDTAVFNETLNPPTAGCGTGGTWPVGSKPAGASWCGALDMAGNILEWVEDGWHDSYTGAPTDGSAWVSSPSQPTRVQRGGSVLSNASSSIRSVYRTHAEPTDPSTVYRGARCLRDPVP